MDHGNGGILEGPARADRGFKVHVVVGRQRGGIVRSPRHGRGEMAAGGGLDRLQAPEATGESVLAAIGGQRDQPCEFRDLSGLGQLVPRPAKVIRAPA